MKASLHRALLAGEPERGPSTVHLDITNSCNTNCITCWDHSPHLDHARPAEWKRTRVTVEHIEDVLEDLVRLGGLESIILSGMGEPFTHPDVYELIEAVKDRGLHLTIITNLVAADAERILELDVDQLLIGVHGATEESYLAFHPSFRAVEWARLQTMLARFRIAKRRFKQVQVIARTNAHELVEMIEFAARYEAAQVNFKLASLGEGTEATRIDAAQRDELVREWIPRATERAAALGVETNLRVFADQLAAGGAATAAIESIGCFMGFVYARILVDGTVLYCCNTEVVVGRLGEGARFSDLWRGPAWQSWRDRFREGRYLASCKQCGKINQNDKIARAITKSSGEEALFALTGRGAGRTPTFEAPSRRRLELLRSE